MQSKYRLKSKKSFNYIYKKGESTANKYIALLSVPSKFPKKFGFSVSKKVGNSVVRNKVKRRLKEIVRSYIPTIDDNFNYILVARVGIETLSFQELQVFVKELFVKKRFMN